MIVNRELKNKLSKLGVTTHHQHNFYLPEHSIFEPPCSIKWMNIEHSLEIGAFSYAVSGYFFGCRIGRYCSFGEDVQIGRHAHPHHWFTTSPFFYSEYETVLDQPLPAGESIDPGTDFKQLTPPALLKITEVGHDVWIGHGAFIMPGVKIGTGAIIGARSVVTKDIPPYAIVGGAPAVVKKYRFSDELIEKLLESEWWNYAPWDLKGISVDDFYAFFEKINEIKQKKVQIYSPKKIDITELA